MFENNIFRLALAALMLLAASLACGHDQHPAGIHVWVQYALLANWDAKMY